MTYQYYSGVEVNDDHVISVIEHLNDKDSLSAIKVIKCNYNLSLVLSIKVVASIIMANGDIINCEYGDLSLMVKEHISLFTFNAIKKQK